MKYLSLALLFSTSFAQANGIDDNCPALTYHAAPVVQADQYLCRQEYAIAYSYALKDPLYSTEYLTGDHTGNLPRTNDFKRDADIPAKYAASPKDFIGTDCNGDRCDKGHLTPDQDFSACETCVRQSFLMSNMYPENSCHNEQIWKRLETEIRAFAKNAPVYVVTGGTFTDKSPRIKGGEAIPSAMWKVIIRASDGVSSAYLIPNVCLDQHTLAQYATSIDAIEAATGIVFDASLDKTTSSDSLGIVK